MIDIAATFEKFENEYLNFESIESPRHPCPDLGAFLLLAELAPDVISNSGPYNGKQHDIVSAADHDEIWLSVDLGKFAEVATEENILELVRCGVRYDTENESLAMFV